jgi:GNAT superfamily N-acetyltransferase
VHVAFRTFEQLDVPEWKQALALYHEAFPKAGRKPDAILEGMFGKGQSYLHTEEENGEVTAMAVTGIAPRSNLLIIDYLAVKAGLQGQGIGSRFVREVADWARTEKRLDGILIEAEAHPGPEHARRIRFWKSCGFHLTPYVHRYIWVPETYRAMYLPFDTSFQVKDNGESLFRHIEAFHKKAFTR